MQKRYSILIVNLLAENKRDCFVIHEFSLRTGCVKNSRLRVIISYHLQVCLAKTTRKLQHFRKVRKTARILTLCVCVCVLADRESDLIIDLILIRIDLPNYFYYKLRKCYRSSRNTCGDKTCGRRDTMGPFCDCH